MQDLARQFELEDAGVADTNMTPGRGRTAKANECFTGPVSVEGNVSIEGLLTGAKTQRLFQAERITGVLNEFFNLEQRLVHLRYLPMQ